MFDLKDNGDIKLIKLGHLFLLEILNLLFGLLKLERDTLLVFLEALSLDLQLTDVDKDVLLLIVHFGTLLSELVYLIDFVLLLREADDCVFLVLVLIFLLGLFLLFRLLIIFAVGLLVLLLLLAGRTLALPDLLHLLEVGTNDVILVTAFGAQLVELGHQVIFSHLNLINLDLLVSKLS